jgi:hypothetical protein
MTILGTDQIKPDSVRRAEPSAAKAGRQRVNWSALVSDQSLIEHFRQRLWDQREFECAAVMVGSVYLVLPRAPLRSTFMVRRPRGPYQVLGKDRYGRG